MKKYLISNSAIENNQNSNNSQNSFESIIALTDHMSASARRFFFFFQDEGTRVGGMCGPNLPKIKR